MWNTHDWIKYKNLQHNHALFDTIEGVKKNYVMMRGMNSVVRSWGRLVLAVAIITALFVGGAITSRVYADDQKRPEGSRLITLFDRGSEQSFMTTAATVKGALDEAGIEVDARDRVEPSLDEQLVASEYSVNIYRARPLVVIDGATRQRVMTAAQSPDQIAKDAGITLYPEDKAVTKQSSNLLADGASEQFVITRATALQLVLYGEEMTVRTQATTVDGLLAEKGITMGSNDRASPSRETAITEGMVLQVWREGKQTKTVEEEVDFGTEIISDANRPVNYKEIKTPGEKGKRSVTYETLIKNGQEVERKEINSVIVTPAKQQVEIRGTKPEYMSYTGGGSKTEWLAASSISQEDWGYADWLVQKESGWNPNARNGSSGACGLAQALPCGKVPGDPHNPVNSLNWMDGYVKGRYGSWANAVAHSKSKGWY